MQTNFATVAALVAGGVLLGNRLRHRHEHHAPQDYDFDLEDLHGRQHHISAGTALAGLVVLGAGTLYLSRFLRDPGGGHVRTVEESIDLDVPVRTAYNQWTQFEQFPQFMATVEEVRQLDDTHLRWRANVAGKVKEWDAEITEQIPDKRIAWRSTGGPHNAGVVTFHRIDDNRTRVMLQMDYEPGSMAERLGSAVGGVKHTARGNLKRFKELVERRGHETGAWRGEVAQQH